MPSGVKGRRGQGWPYGTSPAWSQACKFWDNVTHGTEPSELIVSCTSGTSNLAVGGGGAWWTGKANVNCVWNDPNGLVYTFASGNQTNVDIWKALILGLWSSSLPLTIYCDGPATNIQVTSYGFSPLSSKTITANSVLLCPSRNVASLTVYDDGTISLV
jgi:hypothetical protein